MSRYKFNRITVSSMWPVDFLSSAMLSTALRELSNDVAEDFERDTAQDQTPAEANSAFDSTNFSTPS